MTLDKEYLEYPHRSYGMDHGRYDWSMLSRRSRVAWPNGAKLALWINVGLQFFPLDQQGKPFPVPGGMTMPYPDLRHFSFWRDRGSTCRVPALARPPDMETGGPPVSARVKAILSVWK